MNQYASVEEVRRTRVAAHQRHLSNIFNKASTYDDLSLRKHVSDPPPMEPVQDAVSYSHDSWSQLADGVSNVHIDVSSSSPIVMLCVGFLSGLLITWTWYCLAGRCATSTRRRSNAKTLRYELSTTQETTSQQLRLCEEANITFTSPHIDINDGELAISSIRFPYSPNDNEDDNTDVSACTWETDASFRGYLRSLDHATALLNGLITSQTTGSIPHPTTIHVCVARTLDKMIRDNFDATTDGVDATILESSMPEHSPFRYPDDGSNSSIHVC